VRRLAHANHLRPSYLHKYLCAPPAYLGSVRAPRLAILTNRTVETLTRVFPALDTVRRPRDGSRSRKAKYQARVELFDNIRREARTNHSIRALTSVFSVRSNVIIQALATPTPPPVPHQPQRNPILDQYQPVIDELLPTRPTMTRWQIWEHLVDEHHAEVSYATVRDYVTRARRQANGPAGQNH
jgi:hypothetical protein